MDVAPDVALGSILTADALPWDIKLHHYIDPSGQYDGKIHNINDVGNTFMGDWQEQKGPPIFQNHMEYQLSNQLNAPGTAITGIDPTTFGPTEYFKMKNTDNIYAKFGKLQPVTQPVNPGGFYFSFD